MSRTTAPQAPVTITQRAADERGPISQGAYMPSVQDLFDLSGRVALVTGAVSGLGAVFAEALRRRSAMRTGSA